MNKCYVLMLALFAQQTAIAMQPRFLKKLQDLETNYRDNKNALFKVSGAQKAQKMLAALDHIKANLTAKPKSVFRLEKKLQLALSISKLLNFQTNGSITTLSELYDLADMATSINFDLLDSEAPEIKINPALHKLNTAVIFYKLKNFPSPVCMHPNALTLYESDSQGNSLLHIAVQANKLPEIGTLVAIEKKMMKKSAADFKYFFDLEKKAHKIAFLEEQNKEKRNPITFLMNQPQNLLIEQTNNNGMTPLLLAAATKRYDALMLLIHYGANPDAKDNNGKTALHYAAESKDHMLLSALTIHPVKINSQDHKGNTPLDILLSKHKFTTADKNLCIVLSMFKAKNAQLNTLRNDPRAKIALAMTLNPTQQKNMPAQPKKHHKRTSERPQRSTPTPKTAQLPPTPQTTFDQMIKLTQIKSLEDFVIANREQINLNFENETTLHPLLRAVTINNVALADKLVALGSDLNFKLQHAHLNPQLMLAADFQSGPLLHYAYVLSPYNAPDTSVFEELVSYDSILNLDEKNSNGETLLGLVLRKNPKDLWLVNHLLFHKAEYINDKRVYKDDEEKALILKGLDSGILKLTYNKKEGSLDFDYNTKQ